VIYNTELLSICYYYKNMKNGGKRGFTIYCIRFGQLVNEPFSDDITKLTLTTNPSGCNPADISRIDIELEARTEAKDPNMGNQYHTYTVKSSVKLRN
jgi:hypothetical protein